MKKKVAYIYHANPGLNGAYIHAVHMASQKTNLELHFFVNSKYCYGDSDKCIHKLFFKFSERTSYKTKLNKSLEVLRKVIRYFELPAGYVYILLWCLKNKCKTINISLTDDYVTTAIFAHIVKCFRFRLIITAHDVVDHYFKINTNRRSIYKCADYFLVHNNNASELLQVHCGFKPGKILIHTYPWWPTPYVHNLPDNSSHSDKKIFLFIGFVRPSKGWEVLLAAWKKCMTKRKDCVLRVVGTVNDKEYFISSISNIDNIEFNLTRIDDSHFIQELKTATWVCLPYTDTYTHSAVHYSSYFWGLTPVIATKVGPFIEDVLESTGILTYAGDYGLSLEHAADLTHHQAAVMGLAGRDYLVHRQKSLDEELIRIYSNSVN